MKALAFILAVAVPATASAERRTYDVKATRRQLSNKYDSIGSCGALDRMMKDRHVLSIDEENDLVGVDGQRWHVVTGEPDLMITFHEENGQLVHLTMNLYVNRRGLTGNYVLSGVIRDKDNPRSYEYCEDVVYVDGTRR